MSSLWTPDGERHVPPADKTAVDPANAKAGGNSGDPDISAPLRAAAAELGLDLDSMSAEDRAGLEAEMAEMMRVRREVAKTPAADMLANHMMRLFDLAMIYLEADPPAFSDAATVIEGFRAVLDGVGDHLGSNKAMLAEALSQLQMVFVQVKESAGSPS